MGRRVLTEHSVHDMLHTAGRARDEHRAQSTHGWRLLAHLQGWCAGNRPIRDVFNIPGTKVIGIIPSANMGHHGEVAADGSYLQLLKVPLSPGSPPGGSHMGHCGIQQLLHPQVHRLKSWTLCQLTRRALRTLPPGG